MNLIKEREAQKNSDPYYRSNRDYSYLGFEYKGLESWQLEEESLAE